MMRLVLACVALLATACTWDGVYAKESIAVVSMKNVSLPYRRDPRNPRDPRERFDPGGKGPMYRPIDAGHLVPKIGSPHQVKGGTPGDFSLYVFAMSWEAEWCFHGHHAGCLQPRAYWAQNLTVHGLWPDYGDSSYPTACTNETFDHDKIASEIGIDVLKDVWPNVEVPVNAAGRKYDSFWEHEWVKHGTCTGLSQEEYFASSISIATERFPTPQVLANNAGRTISRHQLDEAYGGKGKAVLQCRAHLNKHYLSQVMICFDKDGENGAPGSQIICPIPVMLHDDSCGRSEIHVASF